MKGEFLPLGAVRHRVAIAGRVTDGVTGQPIREAAVTLTSVPPAFQVRLNALLGTVGTAWDSLCERPDRTRTAFDGAYRFVDLPPGSYKLTVVVPGGKYQPAISSAAVPASGTGAMQLQIVNIQAARAS